MYSLVGVQGAEYTLAWGNCRTSLEDARKMFEKSHKDVMKLAESLSEEQLFTKGMYPWVGGSVLGSYFVSCLSSHYDWAMKKLKAHKKNCEK